MNTGAIFRMSVLNALIQIQDQAASNPECTPRQTSKLLERGLSATASFDYGRALEVLDAFPYIGKSSGFARQERLRQLLKELIIATHPAWSKLISNGRGYLKSYISETDAHHCLSCAGLYGNSADPKIRNWWDNLAKQLRSADDATRTAIGRSGELLSMDFERKRLNHLGLALQPEWVAIEDNTLGYDIKSYTLLNGAVVPLFIEVKATTTSKKRFIITRYEWDTADQLKPQFALHLWRLGTQQLDRLDYDAMAVHIPQDQGYGRWRQVEVVLT